MTKYEIKKYILLFFQVIYYNLNNLNKKDSEVKLHQQQQQKRKRKKTIK